jgi:transcriptional repressor NrdR
MKIIKKNGSIQDFENVKLEQSITRASDDIKQPMNRADVKRTIVRVEQIIKALREDNTSAYEVFAVTIHVLNEEGFCAVADAYFKGREGGK